MLKWYVFYSFSPPTFSSRTDDCRGEESLLVEIYRV
jgi:hypothetical protein